MKCRRALRAPEGVRLACSCGRRLHDGTSLVEESVDRRDFFARAVPIVSRKRAGGADAHALFVQVIGIRTASYSCDDRRGPKGVLRIGEQRCRRRRRPPRLVGGGIETNCEP